MAAQTPGNITNTVPETPDSAIISPGLTSQTHESSLAPILENGAFACGAKYPSQERKILPAARITLQQGGSILPAAQTTRTRR